MAKQQHMDILQNKLQMKDKEKSHDLANDFMQLLRDSGK